MECIYLLGNDTWGSKETKTDVSGCLCAIAEQLTYSTKSGKESCKHDLQACKLIVWNFECRKSERMSFFIFIIFAWCGHDSNTKNYIHTFKLDTWKPFASIWPSPSLHTYLLGKGSISASTSGIRIHFKGKITVWANIFSPRCRSR